MNKLDEKIARAAAKWWADLLRRGAKLDHGDNSAIGRSTVALGKSVQIKAAVGRTDEQVQVFEDALCEELMKAKRFPASYVIGVDYNPHSMFLTAAAKAGINLGGCVLPWKTHMYYFDGKLKVRYGYGAPMTDIEV